MGDVMETTSMFYTFHATNHRPQKVSHLWLSAAKVTTIHLFLFLSACGETSWPSADPPEQSVDSSLEFPVWTHTSSCGRAPPPSGWSECHGTAHWKKGRAAAWEWSLEGVWSRRWTSAAWANWLRTHPAVASPILSMMTRRALSVHSSSSPQGPETESNIICCLSSNFQQNNWDWNHFHCWLIVQ